MCKKQQKKSLLINNIIILVANNLFIIYVCICMQSLLYYRFDSYFEIKTMNISVFMPFMMSVTAKVFEKNSRLEGGQFLGLLAMHTHVPQKSLKMLESPVYFSTLSRTWILSNAFSEMPCFPTFSGIYGGVTSLDKSFAQFNEV